MDRILIECLRVGNGLIAIGIVLAFGLAALVVPVPKSIMPPVAFALGAAVGLAVATLLCGMAALLLQIADRLPASGAGAATRAAGAGAVVGNGAAANQNGQGQAQEAIPEELQEMLANGRFADYHVQRARAAFASGDLKTARYQVGAAMAHEPTHSEARQLRAEIRAAR